MIETKQTVTAHSSTYLKRLLFAAAASMTLAAGIAPATAQTLVVARDMDLNSLDLHRAWCDSCMIYNAAVYEGLVTLDADNKLQPVIAESWEVSDDMTTFTFKLNPNAKFSDGSQVEAKDVKWSWERLQNIKATASGLAETLESVEAPDALTVVAKTKGANSEFLNVLAASSFGIVNSDVAISEARALAGTDAAQTDNSEAWFLAHSAGAGPFVLESYEPSTELRLKRNENYWRKPAALESVIFRQVGDAVAQAQLLQSGQVDVAMQIDPETAKTLTDPSIKIESVPSYNFIYMAVSPGAKANPFILSPEVREAISIAIDRTSLIDFAVGANNGQPIATPIPLGFPGGNGHEVPKYDPERARELLAKAGHADGFTLEAMYPQANVYGVEFTFAMQKIQQDLAKVGIKLDLKPVEFSAWRERVNGDHIPVTMVNYAPDFFGTSQYVQAFGLSEGTLWYRRVGVDKAPEIVIPENMKLMEQALAAKPEEAEKLWFQIGENIKNANVILPMISPNVIFAYNNKVKGLRNSACCVVPIYEVSMEE